MIDIVIVNWNGGTLIQDCIRSLQELKKILNCFNVIVVDNASHDGSLQFLSSQKDISFIQNSKNEGFGRACNQGAKQGKSEFILFLNPDTQVNYDIFSPLLAYMQQVNNSNVGLCGVKLVDENGLVARSCARFPSLLSAIVHSLGLDRMAKFQSSGIHMVEWDHLYSREVDHVIGAFYLIRRKLFDNLHGFDESFFVYYEDLDLSRRVTNAGYSINYLSEISAKHIGGGTTEKAKALRTFLTMRSRLVYAQKHFKALQFMFYLPFALVCEPLIRILTSVLTQRLRFLEEYRAFSLLWSWAIFHRKNPRWMPK